MNKFFLTMSILSALSASALCVQEASADPLSRYKDGELQPATWHKMRPQIRVENRTPIVKYDTPPEQEPVYLIPTGLPQAKSAPVVVLPGPGQAGGAGGGVVAPPGYAVVDPSHPAPARFQSNIPVNGMNPAANLPNGNTTNRLSSKMWPGAPKSTAGSVAAPAKALPAGDAPPKTMTYKPTASGTGSGSGASTVTTAVNAQLTKRFELLKK